MISNFLNLLTCFMTYHVIYPWEYFMCPWEECVFYSCWVECSICVYYINLVFSVALFFHFLIDLHSGWFTHYWKWRIDISSYYHIVTFSFTSVRVCFIYLIALMLEAYTVIPRYPCTPAYSKIDRCSRPLYKMTVQWIQSTVHIHRFHIWRWNQLWVEISIHGWVGWIHGWVGWIHGCKQGGPTICLSKKIPV